MDVSTSCIFVCGIFKNYLIRFRKKHIYNKFERNYCTMAVPIFLPLIKFLIICLTKLYLICIYERLMVFSKKKYNPCISISLYSTHFTVISVTVNILDYMYIVQLNTTLTSNLNTICLELRI